MTAIQRIHTRPSPDRDIRLARRFNAAPETVFRVWIDAGHVRGWRAPRGFELAVYTNDLRPGGAWRCVLCDDGGDEYGSGGVYRELVSGQRLVYTERFDGIPAEALVTVTFQAEAGGTLLAMTSRYRSAGERDRCRLTGVETAKRRLLDDCHVYMQQRHLLAA